YLNLASHDHTNSTSFSLLSDLAEVSVLKELDFYSCTVLTSLIPLSEFSEAAVMKKYGVKPDAETLDIANTAARQKSVSFFFPFFFWMDESLFKALSNANRGLGGLKRMIMGSVSNHVVNNVACHVTAVKAHH
ncbi:PREDICTED: uncharacterized protein LOC106338528, partial [Brassica oleracea var. oleracea]|uniref:uncharacterized protein LOC106338528 n=1 Tax=Brassica oleracea var. oleracea TaxID=109376 RepID=UPI0006A70078